MKHWTCKQWINKPIIILKKHQQYSPSVLQNILIETCRWLSSWNTMAWLRFKPLSSRKKINLSSLNLALCAKCRLAHYWTSTQSLMKALWKAHHYNIKYHFYYSDSNCLIKILNGWGSLRRHIESFFQLIEVGIKGKYWWAWLLILLQYVLVCSISFDVLATLLVTNTWRDAF